MSSLRSAVANAATVLVVAGELDREQLLLANDAAGEQQQQRQRHADRQRRGGADEQRPAKEH